MSDRLLSGLDPVEAFGPLDITGAGADGDWVKFTGQRMIVALHCGAWAGGTSAVTLQQATSAAGAGAKTLGFTKRFLRAQGGLLVETAVAANTFNLDTANDLVLIEIDADQLDVNGDFAYVRVRAASPGANADLLEAAYWIGDLRYKGLIEDRENPVS